MTTPGQFTISFPETEKEKVTNALVSFFNFVSAENGNDLLAVKKKEAAVVLPRPDNTTTFLPILKGTTVNFSKDGGTLQVYYSYENTKESRVVLELNSKGWISSTPGLKAVIFPVLAKDAPKKKTRDEAFAHLKAHSSKLFVTVPGSAALIAEALMSILPTLKNSFEKDLGYINSTFCFPGFDYLADLSVMGLQPVEFGDIEEPYFLLTRVTESKLSALMKRMDVKIPEFSSRKDKQMDVKNCFILSMAIVRSLVENIFFEKDIVVFVDLNNGNLGSSSNIFDCLDFLNDQKVSVSITRVGSKVQSHFCLKFSRAPAADEYTRSWMETALRTVLAQTYRFLSIGAKLTSVTYEKDKKGKALETRHPLHFEGKTTLFLEEEEAKPTKKMVVDFQLEDEENFEPDEDGEEDEDDTPSAPIPKGKVGSSADKPAVAKPAPQKKRQTTFEIADETEEPDSQEPVPEPKNRSAGKQKKKENNDTYT